MSLTTRFSEKKTPENTTVALDDFLEFMTLHCPWSRSTLHRHTDTHTLTLTPTLSHTHPSSRRSRGTGLRGKSSVAEQTQWRSLCGGAGPRCSPVGCTPRVGCQQAAEVHRLLGPLPPQLEGLGTGFTAGRPHEGPGLRLESLQWPQKSHDSSHLSPAIGLRGSWARGPTIP